MPVMVDVGVLSGDLPLYEAIRNAVGERNPVWRARSAEESVDLLLTGRCGVLLIDMAAVSTSPATLVEQIVDQFPDVVVVVAGRREDESVLAGLISDGLVYRFMHKPLSPKRAGMFLNAAMRSHVERREGRAGERLLPLARDLHSRMDPRKWLFVGAGVALFLVLLAAVLVAQFGKPVETAGAGGAAPAAAPGPSPARKNLKQFKVPGPGRRNLDCVSCRAAAVRARGRLDRWSAREHDRSPIHRRPGHRSGRRGMREPVTFTSKVAIEHRQTLERLLFFNGCQERVASGIVDVIDRFGPPEIEVDGEWLRVKVSELASGVQSLFAVEATTGRPLGVAVYMRADLEHVTVLHVGLSEEYCAGGERESLNLLLRLLKEIRRSSRRVKGVRRVSVAYGGLRQRVSTAAFLPSPRSGIHSPR
jgi:hypothetical protein